jgi:AAHS family 4-hydroxybenzoate transporter-like MFS transporter
LKAPAQIDVSQFINSYPLSRFQLSTIALCFLIVVVDGIDLGLAAYIAPSVRHEWGLSPAQLAPVFVAALIGMMTGALMFGPLADRWGRRPTLLASVGFFSAATLLTLLVENVWQLAAARFLCGIGIGAAMPIAAALTAEFSPSGRRLSIVTAMQCGNSLGSAFGGVVASKLIAQFGWHSMLLFGGIAPLVLLPILWIWLPESMRFIALQRPCDQTALRAMASRIAGSPCQPGTIFTAAQSIALRSRLGALLQPGYVRGTLCLWTTFFMGLSVLFLMANWLPTIVAGSGATLKTASLVTALWSVGGTSGGLLLGRLMDRCTPHRVLVGSYALACLVLFLVGQIYTYPLLLGALVFCAGFCVSGAQVGIIALATAFYPTAIRVTGVAWANGIGRLGSILGAAMGGYLLTSGLGYGALFAIICLPTVVAALCMHRMSAAAPSHSDLSHTRAGERAQP